MTDAEKIATLQAMSGVNIQCQQIVAVFWNAPDGTKYYATTAVDDIHPFRSVPFSPVEPRILVSDKNAPFVSFELSPDLSDEEIQLDFGDNDLEIQRLFYVHGEGTRVEIFYYYPQVDLTISRWFGQLSPPENNSYGTFSAKAASGFASRLIPMPRRAFYVPCAAVFGGLLTTQAEIDRNDCPYNRQISGGTTGNLDGGVPFTFCNHTTSDCTARLGNALSYVGFDINVSSVAYDNKGTRASSKGNTNNLKKPLRVVFGHKVVRDLDLLVWRREANISTPDKGFVAAVWAVSEGKNESVFDLRVNDGSVNVQAVNYRFGDLRQPATFYEGGIPNFSGTALVAARLGWVNANQVDATTLKTQIIVHGINMRVYSDAVTYTTQFTNNRVWCLLEAYANRRWGRGYDYARFELADWITAADWTNESINFVDSKGTVYPHLRTQFDCDMQGRITQEQIIDICRSGRLSVPFQHEGKYTIAPLKMVTDLSSVPVFTDSSGDDKNIVKNGNLPAISYSIQSDRTIPNEIKLVFEDSENADIERPLIFADELQQLKAGRAFGDTTLRPIQKSFPAFGIRSINEATKLGYTLLNLGEFDTGGLLNNLRINFTTWTTQVLGLKRFDVICVNSALIARFGFSYFRVLNLKQLPNLLVEVTAQAYPEDYYAGMETFIPPAPIDAIGRPPLPTPRSPIIDSVDYTDGLLRIAMSNTLI